VPSWFWFFAKFAVVIMSYLWVRATFPRVRIDQLMRFAWLCLIPVALLTLPAAALWVFAGRGLLAWAITVPLLLIPVVVVTILFNRHLAPSRRTYRFADEASPTAPAASVP
jgi:NADH-quinone oxidoreductase subunit H